MAQKFPFEKASIVLAEADVFGDGVTITRHGISRQTLWRWRDRAREDLDLGQSVTLKKRILLLDWQQDATRTIKIGLSELNEIIPKSKNITDPEEAKALASLIHAISGSIKCVGELKIAAEALADESPSHIES